MKQDESKLQIEVFKFLDLALPSDYRAFAIPNGGLRNKITAARMKREGVKAGVPDIQIIAKGGASALIELKASKGSLNEAQKDWADWFGRNAVPYAVCRSVGDVQAVLLDWNIPLKAKVQA
ncbi:VRR-NUC domain-containing protein [Pseudochrobactrum sp. sp1633]|uniref:VRR-NUC domain-containing protein n=1 Tax=Pseudochrobactrum sp. sp1633 TaxID=3036706 RepID=UPI0025A4E00F|nr:VRR-NUC domain-containing protein [Pseudochrobactrum sp. sp1633]MDM8346251.1 VRR-NUC domain-containing protein [Pseudochrobactrum sp. sp1633]